MILLILILLLAGLLLFAVEVFLIPGISIAGIASGICLLLANYYAFTDLGTGAGLLVLLVTLAGGAAILRWFMRSKPVDRLSLKKTLDYRPNPLEGLNLQAGDEGTAITRLALTGNARFGEHQIEVQSADGFIDEKTPVRIDRIANGTVYVVRS